MRYRVLVLPIFFALFLFVGLSLLEATAVEANAAVFMVDSTADAIDINPGDGVCETAAGECTLRAAIHEANNLPGADTIQLPAGEYVLTLAGNNENDNLTGDLDIWEGLTITGESYTTTVINADQIDRVFHLFSGLVTIAQVTLTNGQTENPNNFYDGAAITQAGQNQLILTHSRITNNHQVAIYSTGQLTLTHNLIDNNGVGVSVIHDPWSSPYFYDYIMGNTIIEHEFTGLYVVTDWSTSADIIDNTVSGNKGGMHLVGYGAINLAHNQITNNIIDQEFYPTVGAGLYIAGQGVVTMTHTLIANNQVLGNSTSANAGGIYINDSVQVNIYNSTFDNNLASNRGGALYHEGYGDLNIFNSLFTNNSAQEGGALGFSYSGSPVNIINSTFSNNQLLPTGAYGAAISSGNQQLYITNSTLVNHTETALSGSGIYYFTNSILANQAENCLESTISLSNGFNIENQDTCRFGANDLVNSDPLIGPLQDNGGATLTHALLPYSPAVDAGNNDICPATDQRGVARPINTLGAPVCDIGAYEYDGPADVIGIQDDLAFEAEGVMEFVVKLWAPFTQTVTVDFTTVDNTAVAGVDYEATFGVLTFPAGVVSQTIPVTIYEDADTEPLETFFLELDNASMGTIAITQAVGTIILGEQPQLSISDLTLVEGSTGSYESVLYTITVSPPPAITITVDLTATAQTATIDGDVVFFMGLPIEKVIAPGETSAMAMFWLGQDYYYEADETFLFQLENATYAHIADGEATVTILNDDAPPQIEINDVAVIRDVDNNTVARFTVYINGPWNETITVDYATENGTAQAGQEYEATSGTLVFDNPWNNYFIDVPVLAGEYDPAHTTFFLNLSNPTGAEIGDNQAMGVLLPSEIHVNSLTDGIDVDHGDGVCATSDGECTLRAAVQEANAIYGENIIVLPAGTYTLELAGDFEDQSFLGDLDILDNLTIRGEDPETTQINTNGFERAFHNLFSIHNSSATSLILENLTISGAVDSAIHSTGLLILNNVHMIENSSSTQGGAIFARGDLRVFNSLLMNNNAYQAGAIYAGEFGNTIISNTIIISNTAVYRSSAVEVNTPLSIYNSQISYNAITEPTNPDQGGATIVGSNLTMENSEVSYNTTYDTMPCPVFCFTPYGAVNIYGHASFLENNVIAHNSGHGIVLSSGTGLMMDSNFVGNNGMYGVWAYNSNGSTSFINNTFSSNGNAGLAGISGGIVSHNTFAFNNEYGLTYAERPEVANNIFVGNEPANCNPIGGTLFISRGGNIDSGLSCALTNANDMVNTDPLLLPLADNGGNTWTHALAAESPAVDNAQSEYCSSTDQRGEPRPMDGDGDGEALCDSGAYELEGAVVSLPEVNISPAVTVTEGHTGTITVTVAVMLSVTSTEPVTVTYVTVTSTATPEEDYQHITGTIVFDPGQTMHYITLTIYGDETTEVDELFIVRLDAVWNAVLGDTEAVITIENDDDPPAVFHTVYLPLILR